MTQPILYRNPKSGNVELAEYSSHGAAQYWDRGNKAVELKEFADAQLGLLRIADPILTNISQGYKPQATFIGNFLFPTVKVPKESGRFPAFGEEILIIPTNLKRAVGGKVQRLNSQTGWIQLALSEYALGFDVENRELNEWAAGSEQLLVGRQNMVNGKIALLREYNQSVLATTTASYATNFALSGAGKLWATTGDPIKDMLQLIALVRKANSQQPDLVWFTPNGWYLFTNNVNVINRIKYGGEPADPAQLYTAGEAAVARLLGVNQVKVAWASDVTGTAGGFNQAAGTPEWTWEITNGACAGCCITGLGWQVPSFGYTYERDNSPIVESWYDNSVKSMKYDYEHFFDAAVTKTNGGAVYTALA